MRFVGILIGLMVFLSGCIPQYNVLSTPPEKEKVPRVVQLAPLWVQYVGVAGTGSFTPATAERCIYVASAQGGVFAFTNTGRTKWHLPWQAGIAIGVQADADIVSFIDATGTLVVLNAQTGQVLWRSHISEQLINLPAVDGSDIAVRSLSAVYLFDSKSGQVKWRTSEPTPLPAQALFIRAASPVFFADHIVYAGTQSGTLFALDQDTGQVQVVWATHEDTVVANDKSKSAATVGHLSVDERFVCSASFMGTYRCFDRNGTARPVFSAADLSIQGGFLANHVLYVVDHAGRVLCFAIPSGQIVWQHQLEDAGVTTRPVVFQKMLIVGNEHSVLFLMDTDNGAMLLTQNLSLGPLNAVLLTANNTIAVLSRSGWLAEYRLSE